MFMIKKGGSDRWGKKEKRGRTERRKEAKGEEQRKEGRRERV